MHREWCESAFRTFHHGLLALNEVEDVDAAAQLDRKGRGALIGRALLDEVQLHLHALHAFYGEDMGVRIARKHLGWYVKGLPNSAELRKQLHAVNGFDEVEGIFAAYLASDWAHATEAA